MLCTTLTTWPSTLTQSDDTTTHCEGVARDLPLVRGHHARVSEFGHLSVAELQELEPLVCLQLLVRGQVKLLLQLL
jgi:hypothetical protein